MATETKSRLLCGIACVSILLLVLGGLTGCGKDEPPTDVNGTAGAPNENAGTASVDPLEAATSLFREPTVNVQNIVKAAKTWQPSFEDWWGKIAPDFTLNDIDGNVHTLSEYRGKNVVVMIWATWIPTCTLEIPHLKELRTAYDAKDLAILTISNEPSALLKEFAQEHGINFTVLTGGANLEAPFGAVEYAPGTFFIDPRGRFKLASTGLVPTADAKAIVEAK